MQPFSDFINSTPKYLFSGAPPRFDWPGTTHIGSAATDFVPDLKRRAGGDIGIHGSLTLARSLLAADLVDELRLVVAPNLAGHGTRLFEDNGNLHRFSLVDSKRSGGCLLLHYRARA